MEYLGQHDIRALALARRSAAPKPWRIIEVEVGTREDMVLLASGSAPTDPRAPLARISAPHHMLAQFVAEGKANIEISNLTGYTPARISTLRRDPSFQDLVSHYESEIVKTSPDIKARVTHLALTAQEILQERLETDPESFSKKELRELMTASLDRAGHGPTSKHTVQVNDPSNVIRSLTEALSAETRGKIISRETIDADYTVQDLEIQNVTPTPREGTQVGDDDRVGSLDFGPEAQGSSGGGDSVSEESLGSAGGP